MPEASAKIIAVVNGKGGVGKTTTSVSVASILAEKDKVLLLDADPQGSATWWSNRDSGKMGFKVEQESDPNSLARVKKIKGYDWIVVDTPPATGNLDAAIIHADYLILPSAPAPMDLIALIETVRSFVLPRQKSYRVVLTKVDPRSIKEAIEAQNTLLELDIATCHAFIRLYKSYEKAVLEGLSITQLKGKQAKEAETDYRRVVEELKRDWLKL